MQEPFLRATVVHYAAEGQRHMAAADVAEYLVHCEVTPTLARFGVQAAPVWRCSRSRFHGCRVAACALLASKHVGDGRDNHARRSGG